MGTQEFTSERANRNLRGGQGEKNKKNSGDVVASKARDARPLPSGRDLKRGVAASELGAGRAKGPVRGH